MGWALDHADSAAEIIESIVTSINSPMASHARIARLYLLSDILHNSSAPVPNASLFRRHIETHLPVVFGALRASLLTATGRLTQAKIKDEVLRVMQGTGDVITRIYDVSLAKMEYLCTSRIGPLGLDLPCS